MEQASDQDVWNFAKSQDFVIVTRDSDYYDLCTIHGPPPRVIWLRTGNQGKAATLSAPLNHRGVIEKALLDKNNACIEIY
jgi:predicted nuclease of predicted toxin-antitoxin system